MIDPPTGMVTFLFTDIEGSTPLWEQMPDAMQPAVKLHLGLLMKSVVDHNGVTFKVIGDAIQAAFPLASQALAAAIDAQHRLQTANWPAQTGPLKVRMGLHTGPAEIINLPTGFDYAISHTLNRVARIMSAGSGGQILLSHETADLLETDLPTDVTLKDLGEHQMKGMTRLEHLFQVCAPGLPDNFPPLLSGIVQPNNLPSLLTSFIGRENEMKALLQLINSGTARLVTLTGPGGTGKTRLSIQVALSLQKRFPDGIWLVELAPLADPSLVPLTIASVLGLHETAGKTITQKLVEYLPKKRMMIILDNCEHVVDEAADIAGILLQTSPNLQILATSREILGTVGETPFRVPSLSLPETQAASLETLTRCESIRLFVERAQTVLPSFQMTEANAHLVAQICLRLDGIPLAIELAAARVRMLSVEQIANRLDDSFRLLTGGSRTVLSRHQTLRALIDWSFNLLSPEERTLFLRLSVFAGGFTLEAAEHVCSDQFTAGENHIPPAPSEPELEPEVILDLLTQLVDKSLVIPGEGPEGEEIRYRQLETIRQYARDKLHDTGKAITVRDQHLAYFLLLAEEAEPYLRGCDQIAWLDRLDAELDNLRLALEWSLARRVDEGMRLAAALLWFWHIRSHGFEGSDWLLQLLKVNQKPGEEHLSPNQRLIRARAMISAGFLIHFQIQDQQSRPLLEQAVEILKSLGPLGQHWLGIAILFLAKQIRDYKQRLPVIEEAYPFLLELNDPLYLAEYTMEKGGILIEQNKLDEAALVFQESMNYREKSEDLDGIGTAALALGDSALFARNYETCKRLYEKSIKAYQTVKNKNMESVLLLRLGNLDMLTGNYSQAAERFSAGIAINQQMGDHQGMINSLFNLGRLDLNIGDFLRAGRRFAEIQRIGAEIGSKEVELFGLLFQAVSAAQIGNHEGYLEFTRQALDYWREMDYASQTPESLVGNAEILALLLVDNRPDLSVLLFSAIDHTSRIYRESNTAVEVTMFENARIKGRETLGEDRYKEIQAEGMKMTVVEALDGILKQPVFTHLLT